MQTKWVALSVLGFFVSIAACGDDATSTNVDDAGSDRAEPDVRGVPEASKDAGLETVHPNTGKRCRLASTGFVSGAKLETVGNGVAWGDVENAMATDGKLASVTLDDREESAELRVSKFGIRMPETADPWGIEIALKRRAPSGGIEDVWMTVQTSGTLVRSRPIRYEPPWPKSAFGTHSYGQPVDSWGWDLLPKDVNSDDLAVTLRVKKAATAAPGPVIAQVDSLLLKVWYCPTPTADE